MIPVRVTPMSLLRTGIDQMPNRFRLVSQAALTPRATSTNGPLLRRPGTDSTGNQGPQTFLRGRWSLTRLGRSA